MALTTSGDIITEFLVRNNRTTTDGFITDSTAQGWLKEAHKWACGYHKWPFTEGRVSTTFASVTNEDGWSTLSYPEGWRSDSVRLLTIGGKHFDKKNFYKFQSFLEDNTGDSSKIYTDRERQIYINPSASSLSGTAVLWGQYQPVLDVTDLTSNTIFSLYEEDANEALVEKMTAYLKRREHQAFESQVNEQTAQAHLDALWSRVQSEQYAYTDTLNEGMWKRFDVLKGGFKEDIFKRDQWFS